MGIENIILIVVGIFSFSGGFFDWEWFMNHYRARALIQLLRTRTNARLFYMILGLAITISGLTIRFD